MLAIASASCPYPNSFCSGKKFFIQKNAASRYPMKMANNLLAVVLEKENDIARENFSVDLF
jgi:hypothetical protein